MLSGRLFALLISNTLSKTLLKSTLLEELCTSRKMPFVVFNILFPSIIELDCIYESYSRKVVFIKKVIFYIGLIIRMRGYSKSIII